MARPDFLTAYYNEAQDTLNTYERIRSMGDRYVWESGLLARVRNSHGRIEAVIEAAPADEPIADFVDLLARLAAALALCTTIHNAYQPRRKAS